MRLLKSRRSSPLQTPFPTTEQVELQTVEPPEATTDFLDGVPGARGLREAGHDVVEDVVRFRDGLEGLRAPVDDEGEPDQGVGVGGLWGRDGADVVEHAAQEHGVEDRRAVLAAQVAHADGHADADDIFQPWRGPGSLEIQ